MHNTQTGLDNSGHCSMDSMISPSLSPLSLAHNLLTGAAWPNMRSLEMPPSGYIVSRTWEMGPTGF